MITVSLSSVREIGPRDINGASSFTIGERSREIYSGTSRVEAVAALRSIPVGISVLVRHPGGQRSCMNKPSLWDDVLTQY